MLCNVCFPYKFWQSINIFVCVCVCVCVCGTHKSTKIIHYRWLKTFSRSRVCSPINVCRAFRQGMQISGVCMCGCVSVQEWVHVCTSSDLLTVLERHRQRTFPVPYWQFFEWVQGHFQLLSHCGSFEKEEERKAFPVIYGQFWREIYRLLLVLLWYQLCLGFFFPVTY